MRQSGTDIRRKMIVMVMSSDAFRAQFRTAEDGHYRLPGSGAIARARFSAHDVDAFVARYRSGIRDNWRPLLIIAGMVPVSAVSYADHDPGLAIGAAVLVALGALQAMLGVRRRVYWKAWWRGALGLEPHEEPIAESRGMLLINACLFTGLGFLLFGIASPPAAPWAWAWLALVAWADLASLLWRRRIAARESRAPSPADAPA